MKLWQEAKSVNSLGSCPKFCLLEGWVRVVGVEVGGEAAVKFQSILGSMELLATMEQWFLRPLKVVKSGELGRTYKVGVWL